MITEKDIKSAFENMRKAEECMFEATEDEIQARTMLESLKAINPQFRAPDYDEEWNKREEIWRTAEHDKRVAIHMHRMAKWEVQENKDLVDLASLKYDKLPDHYSESEAGAYADSDIAARNLKAVKAPRRKSVYD